jgi:hypothetical protein
MYLSSDDNKTNSTSHFPKMKFFLLIAVFCTLLAAIECAAVAESKSKSKVPPEPQPTMVIDYLNHPIGSKDVNKDSSDTSDSQQDTQPAQQDTQQDTQQTIQELENLFPTEEHMDSESQITSDIQSSDKSSQVKSESIDPVFKYHWGSINRYYYTTNALIGYAAGSLRHGNFNGHTSLRIIKSLKITYDSHYIKGILIEFTNGPQTWSYCLGSGSGFQTETFYFQYGEKITNLLLYGLTHTGGSRTFGGFYLKTDQGRVLSVFPEQGERTSPYSVPVGSGVLISVSGFYRSGRLESVGFQMLNRLDKIRLFIRSYPSLQSNIRMTPMFYRTVTYDNTNDQTQQEYTLKGCEKMRSHHEWVTDFGSAFESHFPVTVEGQIPVLKSSRGATTSLRLGTNSNYNRTMDSMVDQCFEYPVIVPASHSRSITAILFSGAFKTRFTSTLYLHFASGRVSAINLNGYFQGIEPAKGTARVQ